MTRFTPEQLRGLLVRIRKARKWADSEAAELGFVRHGQTTGGLQCEECGAKLGKPHLETCPSLTAARAAQDMREAERAVEQAAADAEALQRAEQELRIIAPYLKDGETVPELVERERKDCDAVIELLRQEKVKVEQAEARIAALEKPRPRETCVSCHWLNEPTQTCEKAPTEAVPNPMYGCAIRQLLFWNCPLWLAREEGK